MIINAIESRAEQVLRDSDNTSYETDVFKCASFYKIAVEAVDLDDDVSGFLAIRGEIAQIGYNKYHGDKRKRFTIAHEIGHYILHAQSEPIFIDKVEHETFISYYNRDKNSSSGEILKEREANSFAAALLMPKNKIEELIDKSKNKTDIDKIVKELAEKFNVSSAAMGIRLSRLGYYDYDNAY